MEEICNAKAMHGVEPHKCEQLRNGKVWTEDETKWKSEVLGAMLRKGAKMQRKSKDPKRQATEEKRTVLNRNGKARCRSDVIRVAKDWRRIECAECNGMEVQ